VFPMATATYYQSFVLVTIFRKEILDKSTIAKKRIAETNLLPRLMESGTTGIKATSPIPME